MNFPILLAFWVCFSLFAAQNEAAIVHPLKTVGCLEDPKISKSIVVDMQTNPYYLRGDFDGDGQADFAVAVKGSRSKRNGVLLCMGSGARVILGGDRRASPPFSNMPDDNFVAPNWEVATRSEILDLRKSNPNVPVPKGESILMVWEDGMHYIYWDGAKFRWSPLMQ